MSKGVWYMLLSTFFFSMMNVSVKLLPNIPSVEVVFFRSIISLIICLGFLIPAKVPLLGNNKKLLLLRGFSGAMALILYFRLLQEIPLATTTTILFLAPIFASILGISFVKEKVARLQWLFFLISFAGIIFIKGFDERIDLIYLILGVSSSFFSGIAFNCIRKMNTSEHPLVIILYFPLVTLPIAGVWSYYIWVKPHGVEWILLLLVGIFTQLGQYYLTRSLQTDEISKVTGVRYVEIIFSLLIGYLFFNEHFSLLVYIGMILTLLGVVLNIWYRRTKISYS
jgi:drug/metabolite transporter (DMT)-like permease